MITLQEGRTLVPHQVFKYVPVHAWCGALQDVAHILEAVEGLPSLLIGFEPLLPGHMWMVHGGMERVVTIQVGINGHPALHRVQMIHRTRNRCEHEERRLINLYVVFQALDVPCNGFVCIEREANNKADMGRNVGSMPR